MHALEGRDDPQIAPSDRVDHFLKKGHSPVLAPSHSWLGYRLTWHKPRINDYILTDRAPYSSPVGSRGPQPAPACKTVSATGLSQTSAWGSTDQQVRGGHRGSRHLCWSGCLARGKRPRGLRQLRPPPGLATGDGRAFALQFQLLQEQGWALQNSPFEFVKLR